MFQDPVFDASKIPVSSPSGTPLPQKPTANLRISDYEFIQLVDAALHWTLFRATVNLVLLGSLAGLPWLLINAILFLNLPSPGGKLIIPPVQSTQDTIQTIMLSTGLWVFWWAAIARVLKHDAQCIRQLIDLKTSWIRRNLLTDDPQVAGVQAHEVRRRINGIPLPTHHVVYVRFSNGWLYGLTVRDNDFASQLAACRTRAL